MLFQSVNTTQKSAGRYFHSHGMLIKKKPVNIACLKNIPATCVINNKIHCISY